MSDLDAIRDAWDKETGDGRDEESARALADEYVAEHPEEFAELENLTLEQCVQAIDAFRAAGLDKSVWRIETWLLHRYEPQNIGGTYAPQVRIPN